MRSNVSSNTQSKNPMKPFPKKAFAKPSNNDKRPKTKDWRNSPKPNLTTIYVGNLPYNLGEGQIKKMFAKFGKILFVRLILDEKMKRSKGIAFVQMTNLASAKEAIEWFDGRVIGNRTLKVSIAIENEEKTKTKKFSKKLFEENKDVQEVSEVKTKKPVRKRRKKGLDLLFDHLSQN